MVLTRFARQAVLAVALVAAVTGCNSNHHSSSSSRFTATVLVSNSAVAAAHDDANLVNPWGIALSPTGPMWVANNGTNTATLYDGTGTPFPAATPLVVNLPEGTAGDPSPTGAVFNGTDSFVLTHGAGAGAAALFIFAGEGGTLTAWNATSGNDAVTQYDDAGGGAAYKGLAIASDGGADFLYATDFANAKIDTFDTNFAKVETAGGFTDPDLPAGYTPFGIQAIGNQLVVTYAFKADPADEDETHGAGLGLVDLYDTSGHLVRRLATGGHLNAPWGIAQAPAGFGSFGGDLLIGNFGDGTIDAFDSTNGDFEGALRDMNGDAIAFVGLWGLAFGNGANSQPADSLFFSAGINDEADGVYGRIDPQ